MDCVSDENGSRGHEGPSDFVTFSIFLKVQNSVTTKCVRASLKSLYSQIQATTDLFSVSVVLGFLKCHFTGIVRVVMFSVVASLM